MKTVVLEQKFSGVDQRLHALNSMNSDTASSRIHRMIVLLATLLFLRGKFVMEPVMSISSLVNVRIKMTCWTCLGEWWNWAKVYSIHLKEQGISLQYLSSENKSKHWNQIFQYTTCNPWMLRSLIWLGEANLAGLRMQLWVIVFIIMLYQLKSGMRSLRGLCQIRQRLLDGVSLWFILWGKSYSWGGSSLFLQFNPTLITRKRSCVIIIIAIVDALLWSHSQY